MANRDPVAGRGSHAPLTDTEIGERLYAAEAERDRLREALEALLDVETSWRGGKVSIEKWYAVRDAARVVLGPGSEGE